MADIFISYSKAAGDIASRLSALLEAEGWTVWWDNDLMAADTFRNEIMKQLDSARIVLTTWIVHTVCSDWARAEAQRAKHAHKLISRNATGLSYTEIR